MKTSLLAAIAIVWCGIAYAATPTPPAPSPATSAVAVPVAIYHADADHLWNRLHRSLWVRTDRGGNEYARDTVNPMIWRDTRYPLDGKAAALLDEFLATGGEKLIADPVKRAVLQHDLWSIYDAIQNLQVSDADRDTKNTLRRRLVAVMKRLAQKRDTLASLPGNYPDAAKAHAPLQAGDAKTPQPAHLPAELLDPAGSWVCIRGGFTGPSAPVHTEAFGGRSPFTVFIKLPGGREKTLAYIAQLNATSAAVTDPTGWMKSMPQFPVGTAVALVRHMTAIDTTGAIVVTPIIQTAQFRVYHEVGEDVGHDSAQAAYKYTLKRRPLFAGVGGGLVLTPKTVRRADVLASFYGLRYAQESDPFQKTDDKNKTAGTHPGVESQSCIACHSCGGGGTINSVFSFNQTEWVAKARNAMGPADHALIPTTVSREQQRAVVAKLSAKSWRSLATLWHESETD